MQKQEVNFCSFPPSHVFQVHNSSTPSQHIMSKRILFTTSMVLLQDKRLEAQCLPG